MFGTRNRSYWTCLTDRPTVTCGTSKPSGTPRVRPVPAALGDLVYPVFLARLVLSPLRTAFLVVNVTS